MGVVAAPGSQSGRTCPPVLGRYPGPLRPIRSSGCRPTQLHASLRGDGAPTIAIAFRCGSVTASAPSASQGGGSIRSPPDNHPVARPDGRVPLATRRRIDR